MEKDQVQQRIQVNWLWAWVIATAPLLLREIARPAVCAAVMPAG